MSVISDVNAWCYVVFDPVQIRLMIMVTCDNDSVTRDNCDVSSVTE